MTAYRAHKIADFPVGTDVRVWSWGIGARLSDVGRTGTVTAHGRTRVRVELRQGFGYPAETRTFHPDEVTRIHPTKPLED